MLTAQLADKDALPDDVRMINGQLYQDKRFGTEDLASALGDVAEWFNGQANTRCKADILDDAMQRQSAEIDDQQLLDGRRSAQRAELVGLGVKELVRLLGADDAGVGATTEAVAGLLGSATEGALYAKNVLDQLDTDVGQALVFGIPHLKHQALSWWDDRWQSAGKTVSGPGDDLEAAIEERYLATIDGVTQRAATSARHQAILGEIEALQIQHGANQVAEMMTEDAPLALKCLSPEMAAVAPLAAGGVQTVGGLLADATRFNHRANGYAVQGAGWLFNQFAGVGKALIEGGWGTIRGEAELVGNLAEVALNPYGSDRIMNGALASVFKAGSFLTTVMDGQTYDEPQDLHIDIAEAQQAELMLRAWANEVTGNDFSEGRWGEGLTEIALMIRSMVGVAKGGAGTGSKTPSSITSHAKEIKDLVDNVSTFVEPGAAGYDASKKLVTPTTPSNK